MTPLPHLPLDERVALSDAIRAQRAAVAHAVTEDFLRRHPDWLARYGELARVRGVEDAGFHLDFLAGAIEAGAPHRFADYARWATGVLASRGIASPFLAENLEQIAAALGERLPAAHHAAVAAIVRAGVDACSSAERALDDPPPPGPASPPEPLALSRSVFLQALLQGDRVPATNVVLEALRDGHPLVDVYVSLFQEALYEIGRRWESNAISVAQEHMATATAQFALAQVYPRIERHQPGRGRAVITGVQGEMHQMGANIVADALEAEGWDVRFLGTNMPHDGILRVVADHRAHVLGISATMLFNVPQVRRLIQDVRAAATTAGATPPRIVLGGGAFRAAPHLWRELQADGAASTVRDALALVGGWAPPPTEATQATQATGHPPEGTLGP